jgi:1,4-alpha-glucan branching enzyme
VSADGGRLAIVLHSHMPYVEGFGTWPFGEEWLFEAVATSYLPLLDVLDDRVTLSVTPVLADQLLAPGVHERLLAFLEDLRVTTHELDAEGCRASGRDDLAAEVERAGGDYRRAAARVRELGEGGVARALLERAAWTSSATHAVLPLLATDDGVALQLGTGIAAHRARTGGGWAGGLWLPECAYEPWLAAHLVDAGARAVCVELTDVAGVDPHRPLLTPEGLVLVPVDRHVIDLVWAPDGFPSRAAYRDSHERTVHHHKPWAVDGTTYDRDRALAQAAADAAEFVGAVRERVRGGGLAVCALDTELLGDWWYEGPQWLAAVLEECDRQGLELVALDRAVADVDPRPAPPDLPTTTWGQPRTLWTWSGPQVADLAFGARRAELDALRGSPSPRALRELLALQSSDWAFLATKGTAGPYPRERAAGHATDLRRALAGELDSDPRLRGLAPHL